MELFRVRPLTFVILSVAFVAFRSFLAHASVDPEAVAIMKQWIAAEYAQYHLSRDNISLKERAALLRQAKDVEFRSVNARGAAGNMVFRIEVEPSPAHPPERSLVRYYRMRYSLTLGWSRIPQQASAVTYFLALFML